MSDNEVLLAVFAIITFLSYLLGSVWLIKTQRAQIDRQNDTIQRLINREPVTYQEVGKNPQKPSREVYAAWGAQMVNLDEEEGES